VLAVAAASAVLLLVGTAVAARPHARLTVMPQSKTSDTTAVFKWKTDGTPARALCRLRWRQLEGGSARAPKVPRRLERCHRPATWKNLPQGHYTFLLVVRSHRGKAHWLSYSWEIVSPSGGSSTSPPKSPPPPSPPPPSPPPPSPPPPTPGPPPSSTDCAQSPYTYLWPVYPGISSDEQTFVNLVNQARQSLGLQPLALNSSLSLAADSHSYWQDVTFGYNGLTHQPGCNGSTPWQRIADAGFSANFEGEVTLVSYPPASPQTAFNMFKGSPPHWALLMCPYFTQIGVGESAYHWTGDLGGPGAPPEELSVCEVS